MGDVSAHNRPSREEIEIAEQFVRARLEARVLPEYPGAIPADLAAAYRSQELAIEHWPDPIGGWKVSERLPAQMASQLGGERLTGPVFRPNIRDGADGQVVDCPVFAGGLCVVEPELVVRVGEDPPPDKVDWTIDEASDLVGELCIGIEIASSPLPNLLGFGVPAVTSDFGGNFGIVVGRSIPDWRTLDEVTAECFIDGESVGRDVTSIREASLAAFAFTLGACARRGRPVHAGDTITTGTITFAHDILPGQSARHVFEGLGEVQCRAVPASPHSAH